MSSLLNATIGEYRLVDFIGAGGMGEVYRAVHTRLGRVVAVKVLQTYRDPRSRERFLNEARIQSALRHHGIAGLHDFCEYQGRPCIIMEYVDGQTLTERIRFSGRLGVDEAVAILGQMVEAVAYIHSHGVIHRDLKSNNVKITPAGEVRLLDFGIARAAGSARVTQTGMVIGTLENLAPELIQGEEPDPRADIWALGVVLYEMLTGRLPFEGRSAQELYARILHTECPAPSSLNPATPRRIDEIIARCLKKRPAERFASAGELRSALAHTTGGTAVALPSLPRAGAGSLRRVAIAGGGLLIGGLVVTLGVFYLPGLFEPEPERGAEQTISVDVMGGSADVYREGHRLGRTPQRIKARTGEHVELLLKRDGYHDLPVQFDAGERKAYSYTMEAR